MGYTDIINCAVGIVGIIISTVAIFISVYSIKRQSKIDLFNMRIKYYYACDIICGCCISGEEEFVENRFKLMGVDLNAYDVNAAKFLFRKETSDFICDIFSKWSLYSTVSYCLENYDCSADEMGELYEEYQKIQEQTKEVFIKNREQLPNIFEEYFKLIK